MLAQTVDPLAWQPHAEVWLLVLAVVAMGLYVSRVIAPKVVLPDGEVAISTGRKVAFWLGVLTLWVSSDWPLHDIAEQSLYSMHMVQHLLLTYVMPPLFLMAIPPWLARLAIPDGGNGYRWLKRLASPVVAGILFNALTIFTHWTWIVNTAVTVGPFHYFVHLVLVASAFLMWTPVCGPWEELRLSTIGAAVYLFLMSVLPTIPGAWISLSETPVYEVYDHEPRLWGMSVLEDQQTAGLIMKIAGGTYLWVIITYLFFRQGLKHERHEREERPVVTEAQAARMREEAAAAAAARRRQVSQPTR